MKLIVDLGDTTAKENLQNIALANGWTGEDDKIAQLLGQKMSDDLDNAVKRGQVVREQNAIAEKTAANRANIKVTIES